MIVDDDAQRVVTVRQFPHVPYGQQAAVHRLVHRSSHVPPADGVVTLAVLDHVVVEGGHIRPADDINLAGDRLSIQRLQEGHVSQPGVDRAHLGRRLGDVARLGPFLTLFAREHIVVALFDHIRGTVFRGQGTGRRVDAHELVKIMLRSQRPLSRGKDLRSTPVGRAGIAGQRTGIGADLDLFDALGAGELAGRLVGQGPLHEVVPDRPRTPGARHLFHRRVVSVADPHSRRQLRRVADGPGVAPMVRGAGLGRCRPGQLERVVLAKSRCARLVVSQDVGDQIGVLRSQHLLSGGRLGLLEDAAGSVLDAQDGDRRDALPLVGKDRVGAHQLQQGDLSCSEREAQTVIVPVQRLDAQPLGHVQHGRHAHELEGSDRRDVQGLGQGPAQQHRAAMLAVIVLGHVGPPQRVHILGLYVPDEAGWRPALLECGCVGHRLDR